VADYIIFLTTLYDYSSNNDHTLVKVTNILFVELELFLKIFDSATLISWNGLTLAHYVGCMHSSIEQACLLHYPT